MRKLFAALVLVGALLLPVPAAQAATPRFQIRCETSHVAQEDPIVSRGVVSAHLHEFFGNTTTNANSTYESMRAGGTTCSAATDTAGYWVPTLISSRRTDRSSQHDPAVLPRRERGSHRGVPA